MKISFDFDGTLSEDFVQVIAKSMMDSGHAILINPDFEEIYSEINYRSNKL
jgi:hypothetical protein